jgi:CSLREA domain-containing protein
MFMKRFLIFVFPVVMFVALISIRSVSAATIVVNSNLVTVADDGVCTLREAITAANTNTASGATAGECIAGESSVTDQINFAPNVTGTILMTAGFPTIIESVSINGPGANVLTVNANGTDRVFDINSSTDNQTVAISGLTVTGGQSGGGSGVAVSTGDTLNLSNCIITGNTAAGIGGGGIANVGGTVTVTNCTISGNSAVLTGGGSGLGGGILNTSGNLTINNSTIWNGNTAETSGGGIHFDFGTLTINNSTIDGNHALAGDGGGIFGGSGATMLTITNTTISGNTAVGQPGAGFGGGISNSTKPVILNNVTITNNTADNAGGGLASIGESISMRNTIVAGNTGGTSGGPDCAPGSPIDSLGFNILGNNSDCVFTGTNNVNGDQVGTGGSPINPLLGSLQNNGGPTETHALQPGSPAIDKGDNSTCAATDQRGVTRPQGTACDIGAFEVSLLCGNSKLDPGETCDDGNTTSGDGCSSTCQDETAGAVCGNNIVETGEECDDGNINSGDGCSATCQNEETIAGGGRGCELGEANSTGNLATVLLAFVALSSLLVLRTRKN